MKRRNFLRTVLVLPFIGAAALPIISKLGNTSMLDRVGVRSLLLNIKKQMASISSRYIFELADQTTTDEIKAQFGCYFDSLKQRRAIHSYKITDIKSNGNSCEFSLYLKPSKSSDIIVLDAKLESNSV